MKRSNLVIEPVQKVSDYLCRNVKSKLKKFYSNKIEKKKIVTTGDQKQKERLSE